MKVELATHFNDIIVFHGLILQSQPHSWDMVSVLLLCGLPLQLLTRHPESELQAAAPPQPRRACRVPCWAALLPGTRVLLS